MHFSNEVNAEKCEQCPSGKFQDLVGQPYCETKQPCAPGTFEANATDISSARCHPCPAKHFSNVSNAVACERCPSGKFQDAEGRPFCEACSEGFVCRANEKTGLVELEQCPPGMRCSGKSVERCVNQISNPTTGQCVSCKDGEFADLEHNVCSPCPPGHRCSGASVERCVNQISNPVTGKCISCEDKHFANTRTNVCTECPQLHKGSSALALGCRSAAERALPRNLKLPYRGSALTLGKV